MRPRHLSSVEVGRNVYEKRAGRRRRAFIALTLSIGVTVILAPDVRAQEVEDDAPSNSLITKTLRDRAAAPRTKDSHTLRDSSLFVVPPPRPREFALHDLVQIVVQETSNARSRASLDTEKEYAIKGKIAKWPHLDIMDLLNLQLRQGSGENVPEVDLSFDKEFEGKGDYERRDDLTARLTAEVIEILPNGHLVLEARTSIRNDQENLVLKVTGICRPSDVTAANTILSNQLHDLVIDKVHTGELRRASQKGLIAKVFDALFAF